MFGNMGNLAKMMKEMSQLKGKVEALQAELAQKIVEGSSGGGMITVKANGRQEIVSVRIDDEVAGDPDREMLEDLVVAATNAALARSKELAQQEAAKLTGGLDLDIPGLS